MSTPLGYVLMSREQKARVGAVMAAKEALYPEDPDLFTFIALAVFFLDGAESFMEFMVKMTALDAQNNMNLDLTKFFETGVEGVE